MELRHRLSFLIFLVALVPTWSRVVDNPEEYVNIRLGTDNTHAISTGNQMPVIGSPWAHTYFGPEATTVSAGRSDCCTESWWWIPRSPNLKGIRCTHQPSPWIGDWGFFLVSFGYKDQGYERWQGYDPTKADMRPYHFGTELLGLGNRVGGDAMLNMTAAAHSSWIQMRFPKHDESSGLEQTRMIFIERDKLRYCEEQEDQTPNESDWEYGDTGLSAYGIRGFVDNHSAGGSITYLEGYKVSFYIELSQRPINTYISSWDRGDYLAMEFDLEVTLVDIKIGVTLLEDYVGENCRGQAERNMQNEIGGKSFAYYLSENKMRWRDILSVLDLEDTGYPIGSDEESKSLHTFYSNLWRTALYPRNLGEMVPSNDKPTNGSNWCEASEDWCDLDAPLVEMHWSPYAENGGVYCGPLSTDSGFWDSYHTVYTLISLLWPNETKRIFNGYVNAYREGGWMPQWSSPGYKDSMVGTMSDVSISDMICKKIIDPIDIIDALGALYKNAFVEVEADEAFRGRRGLPDYRHCGYVPRGSTDKRGWMDQVVALTQNHALADWAIRNALDCAQEEPYNVQREDLGFTDEEIDLLEIGGHSWQNVMNPTALLDEDGNPQAFPQGRHHCDEDGGPFLAVFDEYQWACDFTEGGAWQFRLNAYHDIEGLKTFFGGEEDSAGICKVVQIINKTPKNYAHRSYMCNALYSKELSEMQIFVWGQYGHNNQPMHELQYLPVAVGGADPELQEDCVFEAQRWIKKTLVDCYAPLHYTGDEDNGEMSGWYILGSLGFNDITPSAMHYTFGNPLFAEVVLYRATGEEGSLRFSAPGNRRDVEAVCGIQTVDGEGTTTTIDDWRVNFHTLMALHDGHGTVEYTVAQERQGCPSKKNRSGASTLRKLTRGDL